MTRQRESLRWAGIALRWPVGMGLASWRYMWRTTPVYREEKSTQSAVTTPQLSDEVVDGRLQRSDDGVGPLIHRRYGVRICGAKTSPERLMERIVANPNWVSPTEVAVFRKIRGALGQMVVGDEYVIRMPGPWDGPVRVVHRTPTSFRFATLAGHLEAGQIEFRCGHDNGHLVFEVESWARSGDRLSHILYDRLRLAKEVQLNLWTHLLQRVVRVTGGRMLGGIAVNTSRQEMQHVG